MISFLMAGGCFSCCTYDPYEEMAKAELRQHPNSQQTVAQVAQELRDLFTVPSLQNDASMAYTPRHNENILSPNISISTSQASASSE